MAASAPMNRRAFLATAAAGVLATVGSAAVLPHRSAPAAGNLSRCYLGRTQSGVWGLTSDTATAEGGLVIKDGVLGIAPADASVRPADPSIRTASASVRTAGPHPFATHPSGVFGVESFGVQEK